MSSKGILRKKMSDDKPKRNRLDDSEDDESIAESLDSDSDSDYEPVTSRVLPIPVKKAETAVLAQPITTRVVPPVKETKVSVTTRVAPPGKNANVLAPPGTGSQLWDAAWNKYIHSVDWLCGEWSGNSDVLNWANPEYYNSTPFFITCLKNDLGSASVMMKTPGVDINKTCIGGISPLWQATYNGNISIVEKLLKMPGIDVNQKILDSDSDSEGFTALDTALELSANGARKYSEIVKMLKDAGAITGIGERETSVGEQLWFAAYNNELERVQNICNEFTGNESVLNWTDPINRDTPLIIAARRGYCDVVTILLKTNGVNIFSVNKENYNAAKAAHLSFRIRDSKNDDDVTNKNNCSELVLNFMKRRINLFQLNAHNKAEVADELSEGVFLDRTANISRPPLLRQDSNIVHNKFELLSKPRITLYIAAHGKDDIYKKISTDLKVRIFSKANSLGCPAFIGWGEDNIMKNMARTFKKDLKSGCAGKCPVNSTYYVIKKALTPYQHLYGAFIKTISERRENDLPETFDPNESFHSHNAVFDKTFYFYDTYEVTSTSFQVSIIHRDNVKGITYNEDPNNLLNLINVTDLDLFLSQHNLMKNRELVAKVKFALLEKKEIDLSLLLELLSAAGFKVVNIIDAACRSVTMKGKQQPEQLDRARQEEKKVKVNSALGGRRTRKKVKPSKKTRRNKKPKANKTYCKSRF